MLRNVQPEFVAAMVQVYLGIKGIVASILTYGGLPLFFYTYGVSASQMQVYLAVAFLPWSLKGLPGAFSDRFPIGGFHKRWYATIAALLMPLFLLGITLSTTAFSAVACMTLTSACIMVIDILFEGEISTLLSFGTNRDGVGPADKRLPDFEWGLVMLGTVVGALIVGPIASTPENAHRIRYAFAGTIPIAFGFAVFMWKRPQHAFHRDHKNNRLSVTLLSDSVSSSYYDPKNVPNEREWTIVGLLAGTSALLIFCLLAFSHNPYLIFVVSFICAGCTLVYENTVHGDREALWGICVYGFVSEVFFTDISSIISVYYTAPDACVINGPNFDLVFFTTAAATTAGLVGVIVSVVKARHFSPLSTRFLVQIANLLRILGSTSDIAVAKGWNTRIGLSNQWAFLLGDAIVNPIGLMISTIALAAFSSQTVYKNRETVTYAIVTSWQNLGVAVSRVMGLTLMHMLQVSADMDTGCNFDNYVPLLVLAHIVLPAFNIPLSYLLVAQR